MTSIISTLKSKLLVFVLALLVIGPMSVFAQAGKNYQHWADGDAATGSTAEWNNNILSANKSDYFEGQVIPHVAIIPASNNTPLVQGTNYTFTVVYNFYQSNTNAGGFAFMTTYNISRQPTPFGGVSPSADPGGFTGAGNQGVFYVGPGVDVISASAPVKSGSGTFDNTVTITFKWTAPTTTSGQALIFYGLYIAEPGKVPNQGKGTTKGASVWSGGSLQTTLNSTFTGGLSLQLNPAGIIAGTISGLKYNDVNNNGAKDAGEPVLSGWTIYLDNNNNGTLDADERSQVTAADGTFSFSVTPDANPITSANDPYYVKEVQQTGWTKTQPTAAGYGPITITALTPTSTNNIFGNYSCTAPTANTASAALCSSTAGGSTATFDLTSLESTIKGSQTGVTVSWFSNAALTTAIATPASYSSGTSTVYAKVANSTVSSCSSSTSVSLTVNTTPVANEASATLCSTSPGGTTASFDLTTLANTVKGSQTGVTVSWFSNAALTTAIASPYTSGTGTIYAKIVNSSATTCFSSTSVGLTVNTSPVANEASATLCSTSPGGTTASFDLTSLENTVKGNQTGVTVSWFSNAALTATITTPSSYTSGSATVYAKVANSSATTCSSSAAVSLTVNSTPEAPTVTPTNNCDGTTSLAISGLAAGATFTWVDAPTNTDNPRIVSVAGTYKVTQTLAGCTSAEGSAVAAPKTTPAKPSVTYNAPACDEATFSVTVNGPTPDATYYIFDKNGNTISGVVPGNSVTATSANFNFSNIPAGSGFKVSVTDNGCPSDPYTCGVVTLKAQKAPTSRSINEVQTTVTTVTAAPNPFNDRIRFTIKPAASGRGTLELYNMLGQKVKTVFQGQVEKGQVQTIEYSVPGSQRNMLIYQFRVGKERLSGKLIGIK